MVMVMVIAVVVVVVVVVVQLLLLLQYSRGIPTTASTEDVLKQLINGALPKSRQENGLKFTDF